MKNKISKKLITGLMLASFVFTNSAMTVAAMQDAGIMEYGTGMKPELRDTHEDYSLKLKGDVSFIKNNPSISISLRD